MYFTLSVLRLWISGIAFQGTPSQRSLIHRNASRSKNGGAAVQVTSTHRRVKPSIVVVWLVIRTRKPQKRVAPQKNLPHGTPAIVPRRGGSWAKTPGGGSVTCFC